MTLVDSLGTLSPIPGLQIAITLLRASYENIQRISVYRKQCQDMADRCVSVMLSVKEGSEDLEGTKAQALADQLDPILERIKNKTREWAEWGPVKCFLQQGDLKDGIEMLQKQLDAAILTFGISMKLELQRTLVHSERVQEATRAEFRLALQAIMDNQADMKELLAIGPQPVEQVMRHLQTELQDRDIPPEQGQSFRKGLWNLLSETTQLPPLPDLTGQVELESRHPEFKGAYNDVYIGVWLDKEKVAVRFPRTLSESARVHEKFKQEVKIWRMLIHPNVLPLYGIVYIGKHLYSVSPWMANGTALSFIKKYPEEKLLKLMSDVAEGLAYLHSKEIVHGDLRGANVLISEDHVAQLSDFGLSKFLEDCNESLTSTNSTNPRWFAPEIMRGKPFSKESDIWSLGMTFIELFTGQHPFYHIAREVSVIEEVNKGKIPNRPTGQNIVSAGLTDEMWELLKRCWKKNKDRPTVQEVQTILAAIRGDSTPVTKNRSKRRPSLLSLASFKTSRKSRSGSWLGTATSGSGEGSSHSSSSGRPTTRRREMSIHSIQEQPPDINDHGTYSRIYLRLGSFSSSDTAPSATSPPVQLVQPNRQPSNTQPTRNTTVGSSTFSPSRSFPHEGLSRELSSAPRLQLVHLEDSSTRYDRRRRATLRSLPNPPGTSHAPARSVTTVTSVHQDPLLQQAISDRDSIVYTNSSGAVVAGSLEGLVNRLVDNFNLRKDEEYREVILTACVDFITPEDLFAMLQWRFDEAEQDTWRHPEDRVEVQYNVFKVLEYWLSSWRIPVDAQLLSLMREFCETAAQMKTSPTMVDKAVRLFELIDKRPSQDSLLRTPPSPGRRIMTADQMKPEDLAIALTLLEGDKFKQIMPYDYLANQCGRPGFNKVDEACSVNEKIILWIKETLLHFDALQARADLLKFFIHTASECRKLRNYSSLLAIAIALDSPPVQSLRLTRNFMSADMVAQLDALVKLPDPEQNHWRYREALEEVLDPTYRDSCVPYIAIHLKELHSVLHQNTRVLQIQGRPLVNFQRYAHFLERVRTVFPLPPPDLELYRPKGQLAYLENKLKEVRIDEAADDRLVSRSQTVQATDETLSALRVAERVRLGFRVPEHSRRRVVG